ncbi:hypothetical protein NUITMVS1_28300 [Shewanella xiamenensis]|nr:hypothetical protein NUITMVS1_28300 [Shewanella xiamenensis]
MNLDYGFLAEFVIPSLIIHFRLNLARYSHARELTDKVVNDEIQMPFID